jgi:ribosomal protein S18 acetylase RimI-like enzyme
MPAKPPKPPESEDALKRERAGTYRTRDGRFTVEQSSSGWLVYDAAQTDELGLPLARGPFPTLDGAKAVLAEARTAAPPSAKPKAGRISPSSSRPTLVPSPKETARQPGPRRAAAPREPAETERKPTPKPKATPRPAKPPVVVREIRAVDGEALRSLWKVAGFGLLGDDDLGLARLARRNPGLVLVAAEGSRVIGSALGAWDGRRGWIYHLTVAPSHRRQGIATRLVDQVEDGLRALGCRKVNVMIRPDSDGGAAFWLDRGYEAGPASQYGRELDAG